MIDPKDLQAKSDQMNAIDFVKPMVFRICEVEYKQNQPRPVKLHLEGCKGRPYIPCKSMLRGLVQAWSDDEQSWNGRLIELFRNDSVMWAGEASGGIRISAISGIEKPLDIVVRLNRTQREVHTWNAIPDEQTVAEEFIKTHHVDAIEKAETNEAIDVIVQTVNNKFGSEALGELKDTVVAARAKLLNETPATEGAA